MSIPPILDVACGSRMFYFDRSDTRVLFCDIRSGVFTVTDRSHGREDGTRSVSIKPDRVEDFRRLSFSDATFQVVVFDPPHLYRAGPNSWMRHKYGALGPKTWREDIRAGFSECFRVLRPFGVLIFKWAETQIPLRDVLSLTDERPIFGHPSGKRAGTHWVMFLKSPEGG